MFPHWQLQLYGGIHASHSQLINTITHTVYDTAIGRAIIAYCSIKRQKCTLILTDLPISLLRGFMINEEAKPLRNMTSGMVAMYFCKTEVQTEITVYFLQCFCCWC